MKWLKYIAIRLFSVGALIWVGAAIVQGSFGNGGYDMIKYLVSRAKDEVMRQTHAAEFQAAEAGHSALIAADQANRNGNAQEASNQYSVVIDKLNYAANGGVTKAMTLLALIYHCGREPFIEKNDTLYIMWMTRAEESGSHYAKNIPFIPECQNSLISR